MIVLFFRRSDETVTPFKKNRVIAGICGGIGEYFDIDPVIVQAAYVFISIFSIAFPGILTYLILWLIIPEQNSDQT